MTNMYVGYDKLYV